jgi:transposase
VKLIAPQYVKPFVKRINDEIMAIDKRINAAAKSNPLVKRVMTIPGVGVLTGTLVVDAVGNAAAYKNSREFSASLGLTPRQSSSGGKEYLGSVSKRGNPHIRRLLVQGAQSVVNDAAIKQRASGVAEEAGRP